MNSACADRGSGPLGHGPTVRPLSHVLRPQASFTIDYPVLDPDGGFDFDDAEQIARRLPRLHALYG